MQGMYSMRSPAVKRLMKEAQELREPTEQYEIHPLELNENVDKCSRNINPFSFQIPMIGSQLLPELEGAGPCLIKQLTTILNDNLFEWHFTIRGPSETEFETGFYHGRIILPPDYPMKPPSIIILTPNGRFEVNKKICLSISGHHPESWQPSWSLRTALLAIIGFMPTHGAGALGSLDYTPEERKVLARRSQDFTCPTCGRIDNILKPVTEASEKTKQEAKELASQIDFKDEKEKKAALQTAGPAEEGIQESASSAEATPDSAQQSPLPQQTFQFPTQPFGPSPFPFQMPFMQQGFPQMFPHQGADHPSSNSQVPRFPLPFVGPMMPPPFFPPGMNPGNFPLPPMMPGMGMPPWQQTVAGDSASSAGVSVGEQSQTNAEDSSQGNVETINSTTEAAGAESAQNEGTTHNQSANDSGTQQQTVPQTGSSESVNLSEGLRQRNVPEQSTSPSSTVQSSASPTSTQPAVPQPRTSEPESPAFIIFASIIIGLIFLLLFRRIWSMKYFSLIFQE